MSACLEKPISCTHTQTKRQCTLESEHVHTYTPPSTDPALVWHFHLVVDLAVLPDDLDPGQHVVPALGLQQVLAEVLRGQSQRVLALGLAVGDVDEAAADADGRMFVLARAGAGAVQHRLPLVLVEEEGMGAQHGEDAFPGSDAAAHFL